MSGLGRRAAIALLPGALGCCSTTIETRPADDFTPFTALQPADFPGASTILSGMAPPDDDPALRIGDAALFAVEMQNHEQVRRELLLLEVVGIGNVRENFADAPRPGRRTATASVTSTVDGQQQERHFPLNEVELTLRRFGPDGGRIARSRVVLYEQALRAGWWPDVDPEASQRDQDLATAMTMSLQNLMHSDPSLQELLFVVVDEPSLFSIATHLGVNVHVQTTVDLTRPRRTPPCDVLPAEVAVGATNKDIAINGQQALWADLFVTRPVGALGACGGLWGALARNATDAGRTAVLRLLATRRGPAH